MTIKLDNSTGIYYVPAELPPSKELETTIKRYNSGSTAKTAAWSVALACTVTASIALIVIASRFHALNSSSYAPVIIFGTLFGGAAFSIFSVYKITQSVDRTHARKTFAVLAYALSYNTMKLDGELIDRTRAFYLRGTKFTKREIKELRIPKFTNDQRSNLKHAYSENYLKISYKLRSISHSIVFA